MATFRARTYLVLDLPEPVASAVMAIRRRERDAWEMALPVETTLIGSSGSGCFAAGEPVEPALGVIDAIASTTPPISARLTTVQPFPGTSIYWFAFAEESPLRRLHQRLRDSGIRFEPSRFSFHAARHAAGS